MVLEGSLRGGAPDMDADPSGNPAPLAVQDGALQGERFDTNGVVNYGSWF